ncbi:MAG: DUF6029 family protein [Candidatus Cloacimonetes bacterium]|nr:DUF6029 family protein [Candidatus Cloacimonadota bacterium]
MKKIIFASLFILLVSNIIAQDVWDFSGINDFELYYRKMTTEYQEKYGDDYKINLAHKFQFQTFYKALQMGISFNSYMPKYNQYSSTATELYAEDHDLYFKEYYAKVETDNFLTRIGTFEAVIGSGMVLNGYYDEDFEIDSSFMGLYYAGFYGKFQPKIFAGFMEKDELNYQDENEKDIVGAIDIEYDIFENFGLATAFVLHNINQKLEDDVDNDYLKKVIYNGRIHFSSDILEFSGEYAHSEEDNDENLKGDALYANLISYLGKFTFVAAYKDYKNFNSKLSDLPTVNHSEEPLLDSHELGLDEKGIMGEIKFIPNYENEFTINYAEGWSEDKTIRQSDLYAEYKREFEFITIKTEYLHLEKWEEDKYWKKDIEPILSLDFSIFELPVALKAEYQIVEESIGQSSDTHYEPKLQADIAFSKLSLSAIAETQKGDSFEANDEDIWLGFEISVNILTNTELRLFAGQEKAGKVCRNGVCKIQPEFDGVRLEISTTF